MHTRKYFICTENFAFAHAQLTASFHLFKSWIYIINEKNAADKLKIAQKLALNTIENYIQFSIWAPLLAGYRFLLLSAIYCHYILQHKCKCCWYSSVVYYLLFSILEKHYEWHARRAWATPPPNKQAKKVFSPLFISILLHLFHLMVAISTGCKQILRSLCSTNTQHRQHWIAHCRLN